MQDTSTTETIPAPRKNLRAFWEEFRRQRELQLMVLPGIVFILIFFYGPMYGLITAFQDYQLGETMGFSKWVGLTHFWTFIRDPAFLKILRNTLALSVLRFLITFPAPIIFALLLNEIVDGRFKRAIQSISYLPHFVSWVVVSGIVLQFLSVEGTLNSILISLHLIREPVMFMGQKNLFWIIVVLSDLWKEMGWSAIIYLAAMAAIDPELYQVADIDGAGRMAKIIHVTIPSISSTIVIILILTIGSLLLYGFEPIVQLTNNLRNTYVLDTAEIVDTHVLRTGIQQLQFSYASAVSLFRSITSVILLGLANYLSRKFTDTSLW